MDHTNDKSPSTQLGYESVPCIFSSRSGPEYLTRSNDFRLIRLSQPFIWKTYQPYIHWVLEEEDIVGFNCTVIPFPYRLKGVVGVLEKGTFQACSYTNLFSIIIKTDGVRQHYLYSVDSTITYKNSGIPDTTCNYKYVYESSSLETLVKDVIDPDIVLFLRCSSRYFARKFHPK